MQQTFDTAAYIFTVHVSFCNFFGTYKLILWRPMYTCRQNVAVMAP